MFHRNFSAPGGLYTQMPHGFGSRSARSAAVAVMLLVGEFSYVSIILYIYLSLSYVIYTDAYINITHFPHVFSLSLLLFFLLLHAAKSRLPFSFSKDMICEDSSKS